MSSASTPPCDSSSSASRLDSQSVCSVRAAPPPPSLPPSASWPESRVLVRNRTASRAEALCAAIFIRRAVDGCRRAWRASAILSSTQRRLVCVTTNCPSIRARFARRRGARPGLPTRRNRVGARRPRTRTAGARRTRNAHRTGRGGLRAMVWLPARSGRDVVGGALISRARWSRPARATHSARSPISCCRSAAQAAGARSIQANRASSAGDAGRGLRATTVAAMRRCGHPVTAQSCRWCDESPAVRAIRAQRLLGDGRHRTAHRALAQVRGLVARRRWRGATNGAARLALDVVEERAALMPVPLAASRQRQRGYNQSECLARALAPLWKVPVRMRRARSIALDANADAPDTGGASAQRSRRVFGDVGGADDASRDRTSCSSTTS